ncbi:Mpp10 protein [Myriangium duriaei CBS 260.36]|uniref:U3 small nucleolar ribonucleoprotein protein MPP10 n=1 Tax=Myriangium duriaei CBS 260.36 TaxID=1168546 RepID=A0A9P4J538_9PEZI|nr:Mpp10 protein [Myriangium duriaei CBS 260.36]
MATTTLSKTLQSTPHVFLTPSTDLHSDALAVIASALQPVAASIQKLHEQRTAEHRRKRKRGQGYEDAGDSETKALRTWDEKNALRLGAVHTEGFAVEQVWEQVRRVVEGVGKEIQRDLEIKAEMEELDEEEEEHEDESELGEEGVDYEIEGVDDDEDARPSDGEDSDEEDLEELEDESDEELDSEEDDYGEDENLLDDETEDPVAEQSAEFVPDPNGLNDGFFSIDDFNKQSAFLESADARGGDDGAASDEEEVDWNADPMNEGPASKAKSKPTALDGDDSDEGDGPTFGDMDLDAPEGASDDEAELEGGEMDDMDDMGNANNIMYTDFFAPPAKKGNKNKKGRPHPHNFPAKVAAPAEAVDDIGEEDKEYNTGALSRVHRDLFSDDDDDDDDDDAAEDLSDKGDDEVRPSTKNLSTHEKRQLALNKEISALEATLVSKKPWALSGEASSSSRPLNSLLEEDLAFERTGKPVPVITAEVSADLEALIKSRILARDFQDLHRRRPDDLSVPRAKRDPHDLSDTKSKKSLAELYEDDHLRLTTGSDAAEQLTDAQRKEQAEIVNLWSELRGQLDSLSNFSLRPKAPTVSLEIRSDLPAARMEDARPAAADPEAEVSRLAPGEVYRSGAAVAKDEGEVLMGGRRGQVVAREEMERGDSKRARKRAKERARKRKENEPLPAAGKEKKRDGEKEVLGQLKKGGVKVIGKKGEVTDVEGNKVKGKTGPAGGGAYKL